MVPKKHPLAGRKLAPETIAKRLKTLAEKRRLKEAGAVAAPPKTKRPYTKRKIVAPDQRTFEQLQRDVKEAIYCLDKCVIAHRRSSSLAVNFATVTDEETFLFMAKRYLEGGLK